MAVYFVISNEYSDNKFGTCEHVNKCQLMKDECTLRLNRIFNKPFCQSVCHSIGHSRKSSSKGLTGQTILIHYSA